MPLHNALVSLVSYGNFAYLRTLGRDLCPSLRLPKIANLKSPITDNKFRKQPGPIYLLFQICDL